MIIHKNFMTSQRHSNPYSTYTRHDLLRPGKMITRNDRSDTLDISEEAKISHQKHRVISIEHGRIKKLVQQYLPEIRPIIGRDGDQRNLVRLWALSHAREDMREGREYWENEDILRDTAERIIALLT